MESRNIYYAATGASTAVNELGMREMQRRAYQKRYAKYLLLKAPPASGKSRALMFIALDKLENQGVRKVIVAVPDRSIGASFRRTDLKSSGFFFNWNPDLDLTASGNDFSEGKVSAFLSFLNDADDRRILICTHAALRYAFDRIDAGAFHDTLVAVDEFHHVSSDSDSNRLGALVHDLMEETSVHITAMTGSYFRGDGVAVLLPEDEAKFLKMTYSYYDQLNGCSHLKSLGFGFHFYRGKYTSAIGEVLSTDRKTLLYIPSVNSRESTGNKYEEVDAILGAIGEEVGRDPETGVITLRRDDGKLVKAADLVDDEPRHRENTINYLRSMKSAGDIDIIIALGMAKEGFDWPWCEETLAVGHRGSLTEMVQIIGRCTRDAENKEHAQFTNLIAQPDAEDVEVITAVNDLLKAVTCSLLMEQVLAPTFRFSARLDDAQREAEPGTVQIDGFRSPSTARTKEITESDLDELTARILQDTDVQRAIAANEPPRSVNQELIPRVIRTAYPDLTDDEVEEVRQSVVTEIFFRANLPAALDAGEDRRLIQLANRFVNIDDLSIDLIDSVNPFQRAYEVISKEFDKQTFKLIQETIAALRSSMTPERAAKLWPNIKKFKEEHGIEPRLNTDDPEEEELAQALAYIRDQRRKAESNGRRL